MYGREPTAPVNLMLHHPTDRAGGMELKENRKVDCVGTGLVEGQAEALRVRADQPARRSLRE